MEIAAKSNSKPKYSWLWDSHNTPKNSKWLQENLADMDNNLKQMIHLLKEDADSFARNAELYFQKRPQLMKLVEEFYRAYRALAERYNHATGVIHKAHKTIAEELPNQVSLIFGEDSHGGGLTNDVNPQTPQMLLPNRSRFELDGLQKDVKRNIDFTEESLFVSNGKARKGLNFNDVDAKGRNESERASKAEAEIVALKETLSKMQAEKKSTLEQFEKNLERLSNLESEASRAREDSRGLNDRAANAEAEIQMLRETLCKLESEKESSLLQYEKCLQKISDLEKAMNEQASKAEAETLALKQSLSIAETDKEAALVQYKQCLEMISDLEERLRKAEEDARLINERAVNAIVEVENLKQTISKLTKDKEASELQFQQCLNVIADLKVKLHHAQEETQSLRHEIEDGVAKLNFSEEKCLVLERSNQNLHSELDGLLEKLGNQSQKLTEKQTELVKLWSCVQEKHLCFQEAESALQTLQQLHSQSQEELNNLAMESQTKSQIMKDMETRNSELYEQIEQARVEIKGLNELNLTSVASIKKIRKKLKTLEEACLSLSEEKSSIVSENQQTAIENIVLTEWLRQLKQEAVGTDEAIVLLNESITSLENYVFNRHESEEELSKGADSVVRSPKLDDMCLRIKAIAEAVMEKEKLLVFDKANAYSMLEASLKQIKDLKSNGRRSMRKQDCKTRKPSNEIEMVMKDIVLDQTSDGSSYGFVELKPVKTHKTETKGKSLSEESLVVDKLEIFDGFMDPNREVNKRKVLERLDSDLQKLENLQITVDDLKSKAGETDYETIKAQLEEAEKAIEKLCNVNRKLTTKAETEKESEKRRRVSEQARRGSEKIGRLQLEIQRIQFLLMKLNGEKENKARSKVSDTKKKVLLRDYIYGGSRSVSMKKRTKKRSAFCGCVQRPQSP